MAKTGTYNIQNVEDGKPAVEDTSYKSCLCILLVFISFCALIILFSTITWGGSDKEKRDKDYESIKGGYHGNEFEKLQSSSILPETTRTRPIPTTQRTPPTSKRPPLTTQNLPPTTQKLTSTTQEPTPTTQKPTSTTQKPTSTTQEPTPTTQKPTSITQKLPPTIQKLTSTTQEPTLITQKPTPTIQELKPTTLTSTTQKLTPTIQEPTTTKEITSTTSTTTQQPVVIIKEQTVVPLTTKTTTTQKATVFSGKEDKSTTIVVKEQPASPNTTTQRTPVVEVVVSTKRYYTNLATKLVEVTTIPTAFVTNRTIEDIEEHTKKNSTVSTTNPPMFVFVKVETKTTIADEEKAVQKTENSTFLQENVKKATLLPQKELTTGNSTNQALIVDTTEEITTPVQESTIKQKQVATKVSTQSRFKLFKEADVLITTQETSTIGGETTISDELENSTKQLGTNTSTEKPVSATLLVKKAGVEEITQESTQDTTQEATQETIQETTQEATQETTQDTTQEATQETTQEATQETIQETTQETTQDTTQEATQETTQDTTQEATQETIQETTQEVTQDTTTSKEETTTAQEMETRTLDKATINDGETDKPLARTLMTTDEGSTKTKSTASETTTTSTTTTTTTRRPLHPRKPTASKGKTTSRFKSAVSRMLNLMDHSQDPCEDYYMYSCGGAGATRTSVGNPADDATWNGLLRQLNDVDTTDASDVPLAKLKTFHKSCIEHEATFDYKDRLEQVESIMEDVGRISNDPITADDLTHLFAKLVAMKSLPFMEVNIGIDASTQTYVFQLSPPYRSLTQDDVQRWSTLFKIDMHCLKHTKYDRQRSDINLNKVYEQYSNCKKHYSSYLDSFNITTHAFEDLSNVDGLLWSVDNEILNFTTSAYSITTLRDAMVSDTHTIITVDELNTKFRSINWELFFKLISDGDHTSNTKVHIYLQEALFKIFDEFGNMQRRHFYDYLYAIYTNDVYQNVVIPKEIERRDEYCVELSKYLFGDVFSYLYMKALPNDVINTSKKLVDEVFNVLKNQLVQTIHGQEWLDKPKRAMIEKLNELSYVFQQKNDSCISTDRLTAKYVDLVLDDTFGANYVKMVEFYNKQKFQLSGTRFIETETFCNIAHPFDRKPSSLYSTPIIAIPYGMVRGWSLDYPSYFMMGKVGITIAMEIMRYFDPVGIKDFMLQDEAQNRYEQLTDVIDNEETSFQNKKITLKISKESYYENIRDNAALKLSHSVFNNLSSNLVQELPFVKNDFKPEEVFLISVAQEFCENFTLLEYMLRVKEGRSLPNYWRVNNMVVTLERFKEVYECKAGANLNPEEVEFNVFPDQITANSEQQYDSNENHPSEVNASYD